MQIKALNRRNGRAAWIGLGLLCALAGALLAAAPPARAVEPAPDAGAAPSVAPEPLRNPGPPLPSPTSPTPALPDLAPVPPPPEPAKQGLDWHAVVKGNAVMVDVTDPTSRYRVERIALVRPDGSRLYAPRVTRLVEHSFGTKAVEPSGPFSLDLKGGSSSGVGVGLGIGGPVHSRDVDKRPRTVTRARIELLDPKAYRAGWTRWKIAAELVDSEGAASTAEFPAPGP
ncbi:MAG TPA: hypothetical protein VMF53_09425 [Alphaproteobacteria bacterium]|nr:hypothetical protein [Alphaproteobacteria bacterium]